MNLTFAFSPCPNDTFMFGPIVNKDIDLEGIEFEIILEDIEKLNQRAFDQGINITKLSYNAFTQLTDAYQLLSSGSALGNNCGPLLISKSEWSISQVESLKIAIPGKNTTAFLLLKFAFPRCQHFEEMVFSDIEEAVLSGRCDAGLIIHENRFTYHLKGLKKIIDLGEYWENQTGTPIPLGGIAIQRNLPVEIKQKVNRILFRSIQFAFANPEKNLDYIRCHAQEMDEKVMFAHIDLYVNEFSKDLGVNGKKAIRTLFGIVNPSMTQQEFEEIFV